MTKLTQKSVKFDWGEKEETTFQMLKRKLCSAPILALPKGSENFVVYYDASHKIRSHFEAKGEGRSLYALVNQDLRKNYTTRLDLGSNNVSPEIVEKLSIWHELLSDYNCEIRYHPGKANVVADALSRIQAARDCQKSYADVRRKPREFQVGDKVI
ncbi:putative reverse transcriptase domain-containing protein [Tanacetum coccineum]